MWTLHSVRFLGTSPLTLKSVREYALSIDATEEANVTGGSIYARFVSILKQSSAINLMSYDVASVLGLCGLIGLPIGTGKTYTGAEIYFADYDDFGNVKSGSAHLKIAVAKALMCWKQVQCQTNQDAMISVDIGVMDPDNSNQPIVVTNNVALPTTVADDARFSLGPMTLESSTIGCTQSLTIQGGQQMEPQYCGSDVYPKSYRISPIKPTIETTAQGTTAFGPTIPYNGKPLTNANTAIYLRKRLNNQVGFEPAIDTKHIKFATQGIARVTGHKATAGEPGETAVKITTVDDGTNAPLVISTGVALP